MNGGLRGALAAGLVAAQLAAPVAADRVHQIVGRLGDGSERILGRLDLHPLGDGSQRIAVDLDPSAFVDHFLSMRPFNCLQGPEETVCHLPYPYAIRDRISGDDLVDLEYRLLFIYKAPEQFHAEFFNGLYFRLQRTDGGFRSHAFEVDMNLLMTPPEAGELRPIRGDHLTPIEDNHHWLRAIEIRPVEH